MTYSPEVRNRLVEEAKQIIARYPEGHARSALLPMLHLVQSEDGYVSPDGIALCADLLGLTQPEVSAGATFYTQYKRRPNGEYNVGVCTNALCGVLGGEELFEQLSKHLGVGHDETTADGKITLEALECNAACDYAPVIMVNWEFFDNQTPESAKQLVDDLRDGTPVHPTRGPNVMRTFKQVSRTLAGFQDGLANEGPSGGAPTFQGLETAKEHGWTAPTPVGGVEPPVDEGTADAALQASEMAAADKAAGQTSAVERGKAEPKLDTPGGAEKMLVEEGKAAAKTQAEKVGDEQVVKAPAGSKPETPETLSTRDVEDQKGQAAGRATQARRRVRRKKKGRGGRR